MNRSTINRISPDQAVAVCTREQAARLVNYHEYRASVLGRAGVLLTQAWPTLETYDGPFVLTVVFHGVESAQPVPESIQLVVDSLKFQLRGQPR